jgi:hypothetical protein
LDREADTNAWYSRGNFSATATINWGDGTSSVVPFGVMAQTTTVLLGRASAHATHTYSSLGTFTISYSVTYMPENDIPVLPITEPVSTNFSVIVGSACSDMSVNAPSQRIWMDGINSMLCDAWINNWLVYKCVGSATGAWRKKNNDNIVKQNGNTYCKITAVYRNDDCTQYDGDDEVDSKFGKHVQTIVTKFWHKFDTSNGDCFSNNNYERNNVAVSASIPPNPC